MILFIPFWYVFSFDDFNLICNFNIYQCIIYLFIIFFKITLFYLYLFLSFPSSL